MNCKLLSYLALSITGIIICACSSKGKSESTEITSKEQPIIVDITKAKGSNVPIKLSEFAESISYIPLDENPLLNDIRFATLHIVDDTIYVVNENIYKYTPEGRFIRKLFREGQGPEEAKKHASSHAAINRSGRYFTFMNAFGLNYKSYSFDGKYMGEELVMDSLDKRIKIYFNNCQVFEYRSSRNGYFKVGEKMNLIGPNMFYVKDLETNEIRFKLPNPAAYELATYRREMEWNGCNMNFHQIDSLLWFKHPAIDTLYYTKDFNTVNPGYIFITDNSFMDMRKYIHHRVGDITRAEAMNTHSISEAIPLPDQSLLFFLGDLRIGITDTDGQTVLHSGKYITNDIDTHLPQIDHSGILYAQQFSIEKGYLYFLMDAYKFFEESANPPFPSLTEDSNPVVMKIKLK